MDKEDIRKNMVPYAEFGNKMDTKLQPKFVTILDEIVALTEEAEKLKMPLDVFNHLVMVIITRFYMSFARQMPKEALLATQFIIKEEREKEKVSEELNQL